MSPDPDKTPPAEYEDPIDRFEHEIEALEQPLGHSIKQWLVGLGLAVAVVGGIFVAAYFINQHTASDRTASMLPLIEVSEPRRGHLPAIPYVCRWDAIAGTHAYLVRIQKEGSPMDLISRQTKMASLQLTPEEREKLGSGGKFTLVVQAQSRGGQPIAQGQSTFSF